jgi:hypothetical protein
MYLYIHSPLRLHGIALNYLSTGTTLTFLPLHRLRVFKNRVLRRIFGPKRDEVRGGWRKLHTEELHNLYSSPSITRVIKSRRMRWAGHVARMGKQECIYDVGGKARWKVSAGKTKAKMKEQY